MSLGGAAIAGTKRKPTAKPGSAKVGADGSPYFSRGDHEDYVRARHAEILQSNKRQIAIDVLRTEVEHNKACSRSVRDCAAIVIAILEANR